MTGWLAEANARPVAKVARELGCELGRRASLACPACHAERRGSEDRRLPAGLTADGRGWRCHRCGVSGSAVDFAGYVLLGHRPGSAEDWREVRGWLAERGWAPPPAGYQGAPLRPRRAPEHAPAEVVPARLPVAEVADLWTAARPVTAEPRAARWLDARGLYPGAVARLDLGRALHTGSPCPPWARCKGRPWSQNWPLLIPTFDARGAMVALRGRWTATEHNPEGVAAGWPWREVKPGDGDGPKECSPIGTGACRGAVYADPVAHWLLATGPTARRGDRPDPAAPDLRWDGRVAIVEGGPAFLRYASELGRVAVADRAGWTWAVLGVWNGAWPDDAAGDELARRLPTGPDGAGVVLGTDGDPAGDTYAERIGATLDRARIPWVRHSRLRRDDAGEAR